MMLHILAALNRRFGLRGLVHFDDVAASGVERWMWARGWDS
jgi:hypothetical protein